MCRWLAYSGPEIYLERLLYEPENWLTRQSLSAQESKWPTNGDGFGIGWYGSRSEPGVFRDVLPAWNDSNLRNVSEQISSPLFFAHVRALTGSAISRANCHPFRHGKQLFMHNGQIGGFAAVRRELLLAVDSTLFPALQGSTDSELFFFLLLGNGVATDPRRAFSITVGQVLDVMVRYGVAEPFRMSAAYSDGHAIHAVRFASDEQAPTLYHGDLDATTGTLVVSEPLDETTDTWMALDQGSYLRVSAGDVEVQSFEPG